MRVGLERQGRGFPAGAIATGVVKYLVDHRVFDSYDMDEEAPILLSKGFGVHLTQRV